MIRSYLPAIVFLVLGGAVGVAFALLNTFFGPRRPLKAKSDPYECGLPSEVQKSFKFGVSFYLIAMLFILFDIEVLFLYPVAIQLRDVRDLRAGRDARLRRAAVRRLHLRLAQRSTQLEIVRREPLQDDFRARQLRARDMLRGDLEGPELEQFVEESIMTTTLDKAVTWARSNSHVPGHVRPGLLRDRDDVDRRRPRSTPRASASRPSAPPRARPTC